MKEVVTFRALRLLLYAVLLVAFIRFGLRWIVFHPTKQLTRTPANAGLAFENVRLTTDDGVSLHGWYIPANNARATLLFFHGNGGNISGRIESIEVFHSLGLSVFIFDYRGYGESGGRTDIEGTALDARAAWRYLTEERKTPPGRLVVFGRSLGGAVAMELMRQVTPRALILESTFSSLPDMIRVDALSPFVRFVVGDIWNSLEAARSLTVPTLCIHSTDDGLVPWRLGRRLFDAVASEKTFVNIHGDHNNGFMDSIDAYRPALDTFLTKHFGK